MVAGIDSAEHAGALLHVAGREALLRKTRLVVFHAWEMPPADPYGSWVLTHDIPTGLADDARALVVEAVAKVHADMPDLETEVLVQEEAEELPEFPEGEPDPDLEDPDLTLEDDLLDLPEEGEGLDLEEEEEDLPIPNFSTARIRPWFPSWMRSMRLRYARRYS